MSVLCFNCKTFEEDFRSEPTKFINHNPQSKVVKTNSNNPVTVFYQSADHFISKLWLNKSGAGATEFVYRSGSKIVDFGYFDELEQFWISSASKELIFVSEPSGTVIKSFDLEKSLVNCFVVGGNCNSILL